MKNNFLLLLILGSCPVFAQKIGIGTTNPENQIHIDSKNNTVNGIANTYYDDVAVSSTGQLGVGSIAPKTRLDLRSDENLNEFGLGGTTQTASEAKAGAVRYNSSTKDLSYSDGVNWISLAHKAPNDFVDAGNSSGQSLASATSTTITNWTSNTDVNNSFVPSTGIFSASKNGVYIVNFNYTLKSSIIGNNSRIEAIIQTNSASTSTIKTFRCVGSYPGNNTFSNTISGGCSGIFNLNAGDQITVALLNGLGAAKNLDNDKTLTSLNIFGL